MEKLLYIEINAFCMAILFLMFIKVFSHEKLEDRKVLNIVFIMMMSFFGSDIFWKIFDGTKYRTIVYLCCSLYFATSGVFAYTWLVYSEIFLNTKFFQKKIRYFITFIPALILIFLSFSDKIIYVLDENNCYQRGDFYFLQPLITFGYMILASIRNLSFSRNKSYTVRIKARRVSKFAIYPIAFGLAQVFLKGTPLIAIGATLSIMSIFIEIQNQKITKDYLTNLNNRFDLLNFLDYQTSTHKYKNSNQILYALYLDIDDFKMINDTYGHTVGDKVLCIVADALKEVEHEKKVYAARVGGDEFVIICRYDDEEKVKEFVEYVKDKIAMMATEKEYDLKVSIGYSKFEDAMDIAKFLEYADKKLYKEKSKLIKKK